MGRNSAEDGAAGQGSDRNRTTTPMQTLPTIGSFRAITCANAKLSVLTKPGVKFSQLWESSHERWSDAAGPGTANRKGHTKKNFDG